MVELKRFIKCDCVYSKTLKKLIPVFKLTPELDSDSYKDLISDKKLDIFIDSFKYEETGEIFYLSNEIIEGYYDLCKKECVYGRVIHAGFYDDRIIGKSVCIDEFKYGSDYKRIAKIKKIISCDIKLTDDRLKDTTYIKPNNLDNYIKENNLIIYKEDVFYPNECDIVEVRIYYTFGKYEGQEKENAINFLMFLEE